MARLAPAKVRAAALSLLLLGACSSSDDWITVEGSAPLDRIVLSPSGEAAVHARPDVELRELVSMEPFLDMGLRPGMTAGEAESLLGEPDYVATESNGRDQVFGYRSTSGVVEIVKQHVSSEGSEVDRWFVRSQPEHCMDLIDRRIVRQLQDLERFPRAMRLLVGPEQTGVVSIYFEDEHSCSKIWWLAEDPGVDLPGGDRCRPGHRCLQLCAW